MQCNAVGACVITGANRWAHGQALLAFAFVQGQLGGGWFVAGDNEVVIGKFSGLAWHRVLGEITRRGIEADAKG
jgi:hypothetical protein